MTDRGNPTDCCAICGVHWLDSDVNGRWDPNYVHYGECLTEWWRRQREALAAQMMGFKSYERQARRD